MAAEQYCRSESEFSANLFLIAGNSNRVTDKNRQEQICRDTTRSTYHPVSALVVLALSALLQPPAGPREVAAGCRSHVGIWSLCRQRGRWSPCRQHGAQTAGRHGHQGVSVQRVKEQDASPENLGTGMQDSFSFLAYEGNQAFSQSKPKSGAFLSKQNPTL